MQSGANVTQPQRLALPWREPLSVARQLAERDGEAGLIWLDGDGSDLGRWVTLASDPQEVICCRGLPGEADANDPFAALDRLGPGHWTGWLSYEAAAWCEPTNPWSSDAMASLWWRVTIRCCATCSSRSSGPKPATNKNSTCWSSS